MIFYTEKEFHQDRKSEVNQLLGVRKSVLSQLKNGFSGSALYRLTEMSVRSTSSNMIDLNSRCNFEKYSDGLLLRINHAQNLYFVIMSYKSIDEVKLVQGEIKIISPVMRWLYSGLSYKYFHYLGGHYTERVTLKIKTGHDYICLDSNGHNFYSEEKYFRSITNKFQSYPSI